MKQFKLICFVMVIMIVYSERAFSALNQGMKSLVSFGIHKISKNI